MGRNSGKCAWCGNNVSTKRANSYLKTPVWCWEIDGSMGSFITLNSFNSNVWPQHTHTTGIPKEFLHKLLPGGSFLEVPGVCCILRLHGDASSKGYLRGIYVLPADMDMAWKRSPSFGVEIWHRLCRTFYVIEGFNVIGHSLSIWILLLEVSWKQTMILSMTHTIHVWYI